MRWFITGLCCGLLATGVWADTGALEQHADCQRVLSNDCIVVRAEGETTIPMRALESLLNEDDLLTAVQDEYQLMQQGEEPEFVIQCVGPSRYHYVNRKGQETDITEVIREVSDDGVMRMALYSSGRRFFGRFESVIDIRVTAHGTDQSQYDVTVYAYPQNAISRFFIRHLGLVEAFFRDKTKDIADLSTEICMALYERQKGDVVDAGSQHTTR